MWGVKMKKSEFKNFIARYLSLKDEEVEVYRVVLRNEPITAGEIALYVKKPYEEVNNVLRALREKELIVQLPGIVERYIVTPPYQAFTEYLSEVEGVIKKEVASSKKKFEKYLIKTKMNIEKVSKTMTGSLDDSIKALERELSTIKDTIEDLAGKSLGSFEKNLKDMGVREANLLEEMHVKEETLLDGIEEKVRNIVNESSKNLTLSLNELKEQLTTTLLGEKKTYEEEISRWKTESSHIIKNSIGELKSNLSGASNELKNLVAEIEDGLSKTIDGISNIVDTSCKNDLSLIENSISTIQNKVLETLDEGISIQKEEVPHLGSQLTKTTSELSLFFNNYISEIRNTIESDLNTWLREEENYLNSLLEKTKELLSTSKVTTVESLDKVDEEVTSRLSLLKSSFLEFLKNVNVNVSSYLQKDLERIKKKFSTIEKEANQMLLDNLKDYEEVAASLEKSAVDILNISTTTLAETQKIVEENIQSKLSSALENYKASIENLLGSATATIKSVKETVESEVTSLKEEFQKEIKNRIEKFSEEITVLKQELENTVSSGLLKLRKEADTAKKTVKETISTALSDIKAIVEALERKLISTEKYFNKAIEMEATRISESINNIRNASEEKIAEYEQLLRNVASQVEQSALTTIYNCFEEFSKGLEATENSMVTSFETNLSALNQIFTDVEKDVNGTLTSWVDSTTQEAKKLEDIIRKTFSQIVEEYKVKNESMRSVFQKKIERLLENREIETKDVAEKLNSYTLDMENKLAEIIMTNDLHSIISEGRQAVEENMSSYAMKMKEETSNQLEKVRGVTSKIIEDTKRKLDVVLQKTESYTVNSSKETLEVIDNILNRLVKIADDAKERISNITLEYLTNFKEAWKTSRKDILTRLEVDSKNFDKKLVKTKNKITKILSISSELLKTSAENLKTSMYSVFDNHLQLFETCIENLEDLLKDSIGEEKQYQAELYANIENEIKNAITTIKQTRNILFEAIEKSRTTLTSNISALAGEFVNNILQDTLQVLSSRIEEYTSFAVDLRGKIEKHLAELPKEIKALIDKLNLEKYAKTVLKKTEETREVLAHIWEEIKKIKPLEIERIWYIVGKEAIFTYIKDVITRTEKSVTIALPTLKEISPFEEYIKSLKPPKKVYLIADVKMPEDSEKVRELLKLKYIRIRSRPQRDCYGIIRDGKEILIAPASEKREIVALVSDKPEYVELFQELAGNMWIKQSKSIGEKEVL